ncbi:hypothetical protein BD779DRAFT_1398373, partial [Infundibulicybe gibba]
LKLDTQDFMGRMEGFAVQGVQGVAKNHQKCLTMVRGELRTLITEALHTFPSGIRVMIMGDTNACLHYVDFWCKITQKYLVVLDGWPVNLPFKNFNNLSSSLPELSGLLSKWKSGQIRWRKLTE